MIGVDWYGWRKGCERSPVAGAIPATHVYLFCLQELCSGSGCLPKYVILDVRKRTHKTRNKSNEVEMLQPYCHHARPS